MKKTYHYQTLKYVIFDLASMATLLQEIVKRSVLASRTLEAIRMLSVLPKCMDSVLSSNHPRIAFSSMLSVLCMSVGFLPLTSRVESSAYRKISQFTLVIISLTYILKSIGPNMEPCGTPHVMFPAVDALPFTLTTWPCQIGLEPRPCGIVIPYGV